MKRRNFIGLVSAGSGAVLAGVPLGKATAAQPGRKSRKRVELSADLVIAGGGMGGCAAALAACRNGLKVILTEETDWIGGQVSQQGVPPDEHRWIETHGAPPSYRDFRKRVRDYYRRNYPLTTDALGREFLNPGNGGVSRVCHEPRVAVAVLEEMLAPYMSSGKLVLLRELRVTRADSTGDKVSALEVVNEKQELRMVLKAPLFIDATECGDLLPLTGTEYVTGTEPKMETGELHAPEKGNPENNQAFTLCFAMDYQPGIDNRIDRPANYDFWRNYIPPLTPPWSGRLFDLRYSNPQTLEPKALDFHPEGVANRPVLNLWNYRKMIDRNNFTPGYYDGDITLVNWPQNDYMEGNLIGVSRKEFDRQVEGARQLNFSLFYWLQTEAPRPDGGMGWPGLRLRGDVMGTPDGMAKYPYIRESRRIKALFTVLEEHVGAENRKLVAGEEAGKKSAFFYDSVGIGYYHIDLHPSNRGNNYIDFGSLPFQIPLGALLPQRVENLLPANKNIGTTHITNGCYRLHPVEWSIGEAAGCLAAFAGKKRLPPRAVRENRELLNEFQDYIRKQGIETNWPE